MKMRRISWQQTIPLRHRVLWPNKPLEYCHIPEDDDGLHFGVFVDDLLVCVASVYLTLNKARLRKFATDPQYQNQGIGSQLLTFIITFLKAGAVDYFWCDARESALEFYKRFDMHVCSERFFKGEVAYYKMEVAL